MKIYVITKGSYSGYHICAVSTNQKNAEKLQKIFSGRWDQAMIEEYESDQYLTETESGMELYKCVMGKDGTILADVSIIDLDYINDCDFRVRDIANRYLVYVWTKDSEHAKKIATDKIAEFKATRMEVS